MLTRNIHQEGRFLVYSVNLYDFEGVLADYGYNNQSSKDYGKYPIVHIKERNCVFFPLKCIYYI